MARNPATPTAWIQQTLATVTYADRPIVCRCSKHPHGVLVYRNETAKALSIDDAMNAGEYDRARFINLTALTMTASRHAVAGDDSIAWLGCAVENNRRQQDADPAPVGTPTYSIDSGTTTAMNADRRIRESDERERERRARAL